MFGNRRRTVFGVIVLVAGVMCSTALAAGADEEEAQASALPAPSVAVDATWNGKYVWRGINVVDGSVLQPSATIGWGGLSANVWGNMDLSNVNGQSADFTEYDLTLDYSWALDSLGFSVGSIYYTFPHSDVPSTAEVYAGAGLDIPLSPSLTVYQDVDEADGTYSSLSVGHTFEGILVLADGVAVSADLGASIAHGSSNFNDFYYGSDSSGLTDSLFSLSLPVSLGEYVSVAPAAHYSSLLDDDIRDSMSDDDNFWAGITLSCSF